MDSTGVPHILEHTTLCGSQKYPCRDPFFKMLNRSLSTFMNAWTASDYTMYPFSTMNPQDFENLLSVYLDAAFFPRLRELDFRQEGWRLEHENNQDCNSPIIFKGVVFNEMKGALTSPEQLFGIHLQNKLMPSNTYSHNSGGEPLNIPDLTWQQLREFHATHYHPSNARFYSYGNLPMERNLELIDKLVLQKFDKIEPKTEVPNETRWDEPREFHVHCAPDPMAADPEKQTTISVNYLLGTITDQYESFLMSFISSLLVHGPPAPFYKSLITANIGSDYSAYTGYNGSTKDASFSIGLQGIKKEDLDKVKQLIEQTFDEVIQTGFESERIEAILHMIELSQKHQTTMFGLGIISSLMSSWNHDADPVTCLQVNKHVNQFKQSLKDNPKFLQEKVRQYFKENSHKMVLVMTPKEDFKKQTEEAEQQKLSEMVARLSTQDKEKVFQTGLALAEEQNKEEDLSSLPTLRVSDISPQLVRTHFDLTNIGGVQVQCCQQPTNGITYFRGLSSMKTLPDELLPYVPLFCGVITRLGAGDMSFQELAQREELKTGGLGMGTHLVQYHSDVMSYEQGVTLSSSSLDRNLPEMFSLWTEIFNRPTMSDNDRLSTLVRMSASDLAMSLANSGHAYAMKGASSSLTPVARLKQLMGGMTQVTFMKGIAECEDMMETMTKLKQVASHLLNKENMRCAINSSPEFMSSALSELESFLETLPGQAGNNEAMFVKQACGFVPSQERNHYELPFPVNYMSRGIQAVPYTHPDFPTLRILARLMSAKFLHREIREKGGAYGSGASMGTDGVFKFYSYRDPNSINTLESFSHSVEWAIKGDYTQQDIDEAKLSIFSAVDGPVAPSDKAMTFFLSGISDDMRQQQREGLFAANKQSLIDVAQRYLTPNAQVTAEAFLGPENTMSQDKAGGWKIHKEAM
ncbi:presequence protease, mitochondrial-like isoform X2 [Amphiura filiformis]